MSAALAVLWKDLLSEWRSRDRVISMLLFSLLVVVVLHFALPPDAGSTLRAGTAGLLWVAYVFAAVLGMNRSFALELENEALSGLALAPADRGYVYLGKAAASFVLLAAVQAATAFAFALAFDVALLPVAARFAGIAALGGLGLSAIGTLFAAVAVRTRQREVMLPLLLLPVLVPLLLGAVRATAALLDGDGIGAPLRLLAVSDAIYLIVSFVLFDFVLDE
ncbi:MAG TPA: heme exporter protein CcmB [Myxococcota bacterium]|nr:heme exporter protein CcmB [Myxococcota bacterium]